MLIIAAVILFLLHAFGVNFGEVDIISIGLACFALAFIVPSPFGMISFPSRN